jgi:hypothetical protein
MTDPAFYREEAERCRQLAAASPGTDASKRWRALADEYLQLALASDEPLPGRNSSSLQYQVPAGRWTRHNNPFR